MKQSNFDRDWNFLLLDRLSNMFCQSYYRDALWNVSDIPYIDVHTPLHPGRTREISYWGWDDVSPSWSWPGREGEKMKVDVYSNADKVTLFLNDFQVGRGAPMKVTASFEIEYAPGTLRAVAIAGVDNGDHTCHEPDLAESRSLFNGLCQVIVCSKAEAGTLKLVAKTDDGFCGELLIPCLQASQRRSLPASQKDNRPTV